MSLLKKLFGSPPPQDRMLTYPDYVRRYAALIERHCPANTVEVHVGASATESWVIWTMPKGTRATQYFGNWYARYRNGEAGIDALMAAQLEEARFNDDLGETTDPARIFPVMKPAAWAGSAKRQMDGARLDAADASFITSPFCGDMVVAYAIDTGDTMEYITRKTLSAMGLDEAALHERAIANLTAMLPALKIEGSDGRYAARLDRNYDASMLLILPQWRGGLALEGPICIAMPARDEVMLCAAEDRDGRESLAAVAAEIASVSAYSLSRHLYQWTSDDGFSVADAR
ncbi:DUF1444 family protein [Sphingomonas sp. QA11]|uniref:DUF1444 family protein n=1 Tax=Sphingomonas sp. QA11 TaxID=2950605 RepID=UPI00234B0BC4|nr:DUF1444 family protein [Sphingomonas sp. QA11]WCM25936.1 DUF1444 family protein [Sphingomonas sp. QA11]WCM28937.1 DUF1444 family protein [Sphingomonas sp. QA11]